MYSIRYYIRYSNVYLCAYLICVRQLLLNNLMIMMTMMTMMNVMRGV